MAGSAYPSLKVVKSFTYEGAPRAWSNRYHFRGTTPPDNTHWTTLADAVVTAEKAVLFDFVTITDVYGYNAGSDIPVFHKAYTTVGTLASAGATFNAGDAAIIVRYSTASRTSKNHPLYLFSYYHGVAANAAASRDTFSGGHLTAHNTYAAAWVAGFNDGSIAHIRCGPNGDQATGYLVEGLIRHRDFPRG